MSIFSIIFLFSMYSSLSEQVYYITFERANQELSVNSL
nr:MAG TPA: hypothetical protein [Caudoviricetes sp.]